jgi:hypothetical protein
VRWLKRTSTFRPGLDSNTLTRALNVTGLSGREPLQRSCSDWEASRILPRLTEKERRAYQSGELTPSLCRSIRERVLAEVEDAA